VVLKKGGQNVAVSERRTEVRKVRFFEEPQRRGKKRMGPNPSNIVEVPLLKITVFEKKGGGSCKEPADEYEKSGSH